MRFKESNLFITLFLISMVSSGSIDVCKIVTKKAAGEVRFENISSLHGTLFDGNVLTIANEKHYLLPSASHFGNTTARPAAIAAWKMAWKATEQDGEGRKLLTQNLSSELLSWLTREEGYSESYEIQTPSSKLKKFNLPDGTEVFLSRKTDAAMLKIIEIWK